MGEEVGEGAADVVGEVGEGGGEMLGVTLFLNESLSEILSDNIFFSFLGLLMTLFLMLSSVESSVLL